MPAQIVERVPPQSEEAEQAVLGAMLLDERAVPQAIELLRPTHFYRESHRKIFSAICHLFEKSVPTDLLTLREELEKRGELETIGGSVYLSTLVSNVATTANIGYYSQIVKNKSSLRELINTSSVILSECYESGSDVDALLDEAERRIFQIATEKVESGFVPINSMVDDTFEMVEKLLDSKHHITGIPSGYYQLDDLTRGFQKSDLIIVAGRPGMGKTSLALSIALYTGLASNKTTGIFSLEMSKEQLMLRLLCGQARVDSKKVRTGHSPKEYFPKLTSATEELRNAPIYIDDTPNTTVLEMKAKARRLKAKAGLDIIFIDYLQLMNASSMASSHNRQQQVTEITRSLKGMAKELDVPVVCLSQLSRAPEQRTPPRPVLSDLRESGAIEQDADVVIFIYRPDYYKGDQAEPDEQGIAEIIIAKQRNGPTNTVKLTFIPEYTRFENYTGRDEQGGGY